MIEIKAYVRPMVVDPVIHALEQIGVKGMTVIPVDAIGALADDQHTKLSPAYVEFCSRIYKIELVCHKADEDLIVSTIQREASTGKSGDGMIFTSPIQRAIKIRTGQEGHVTLDRPSLNRGT